MTDAGVSSPKKGPASLSISSSHASSLQRKGIVGGGDFDFNLGSAKAKMFKDLDEKTPPNFRKFFHSTLYDRILQTCLLYFTAMFQNEWVVKTMERSRKQHLDGYNPYVVAARIHELEEEMKQLRMQISPIYSEIILKHSSYEKPQQDRLFFEALYHTLICLMDEAFARLQKRPEIEREVGQLFRTKHFNLYKRRNQPPRSVDSLTVKELYTIKHETENRALNAKLLSSLFEKPATLGVTVASVTNSPLITQYIMSPIVARSMMKDPEARKDLFKKSSAEDGDRGSKKIGQVFKATAMIRGVDPSRLPGELSAMSLPAEAQGSIGLLTADRSRRPEGGKRAAPGGIALPEAAGLPTDEIYNYLTLLKRYILYGPQLGMVAGAGGAGSAIGQNSSLNNRTTEASVRGDSREARTSIVTTDSASALGRSNLSLPATGSGTLQPGRGEGSRLLAQLSSMKKEQNA